MILINKNQISITVITLLSSVLLISGCSVRVADLTLISTKNIDLSNAKLDLNKGQRAKGDDCVVLLLGIPLGVPNLEKAVDNALEKGNGNVMVDQVTYSKLADFIIAGQSCIEVEGTILNTNTTNLGTNKAVAKEPISFNETTPKPNYEALPVTQTEIEYSAPNHTNIRHGQFRHSGGDLRNCLKLQSNEAIAKCASGK